MVHDARIRGDYERALDQLRMLAQRDLLRWWRETEHFTAADLREFMLDPFTGLVATYGEQAAYASADYLFLSRSLDDELAGLPFPDLADPVTVEQAKSSMYWATDVLRQADDQAARALALKQLSGTLNRLILQPGRDTVLNSTLRAGTGFARVAEPGACPFCLMLAGRGAVYSKKTALGTHSYHDNCRCIGMEVKTDDDLPQLNKDLGNEWQEFRELAESNPDKLVFDANGWASYYRRKRSGTLDSFLNA